MKITPQEEASRIYVDFYNAIRDYGNINIEKSRLQALTCSIICINEIIKNRPMSKKNKYWKAVRTELYNLK